MPLDTILLWLGLLSGVLLLSRGASGLWAAKAVLLILAGAAGVVAAPLSAGWIVGALWAVLVAVPVLLTRLASAQLLAQRHSAALLLTGAVYLLHPGRTFQSQFQLVRALAQASRGAFDPAIARFARLAQNPKAAPGVPLIASFHKRRLENHLDLFLAEVAWERERSPTATMMHLAALATLGRTDELVALQAEQGQYLRTAAARQANVWAFALVALFAGTGRVTALERLYAGPLRRMAPGTRAFQLALAKYAAGTATTDAHQTLSRLTQSPDCDLGLRASRALAAPPAPISLLPAQSAVVDATEADLDDTLTASHTRPRLFRSPVTLLLIAINLVAFAAELAWGGGEDASALQRMGALSPTLVTDHGQWWRVATAMFLHLGWVHLGINMLSLAALGTAAERAFKWWRTLSIYLAAGLGSMAGIVLLVRTGWMEEEWVLGASGAIMGLFGALVVDAARTWRLSRSPADRSRLAWLVGLVLAQAALDVATPQISFAGHALGGAIGVLTAIILGHPRTAMDAAPPSTPFRTPEAPANTAAPGQWWNRRKLLVLPASAIALTGALAFPRRREQAEAQAVQDAASSITPEQIAAIRKLRFIFVDHAEAGGPAVNPLQPFGSPDPLTDLAAATGPRDPAELQRLYRDVMEHLPIFCANAQLAPGSYEVDGKPLNLSAEQLRLIPALSWETPDFDDGVVSENGAWPIATVDFKRPYGDMSYFEADMADALGVPVGRDAQGRAQLHPDILARLDALHRSMAEALQAFVQYAVWSKVR